VHTFKNDWMRQTILIRRTLLKRPAQETGQLLAVQKVGATLGVLLCHN
jgi:hypothetical protein